MFITATALAVAIAALPPPAIQNTPGAAHESVVTQAKIDRAEFQDAMRKLWEDHVTWTRLYIVSAIAGLPDAQSTAERLLQNQADIGNAIKPFYGEAAGNGLTALLKPHILIAAELVAAAKAGKSDEVKAASTRWYDNANEIADFLSAANAKNWPRETMRREMKHHLDLTLQEAQARLRADWKGDIEAYELIHSHILGMADVLSKGIVSQFPQRFR